MTDRVSIAQMRLLGAFEHHHSIGAVARSLGLSQPTVSQNLSALESRLGVTLVNRGPDGSRLTEQGKTIVTWAQRLLQEADELDALLTGIGHSERARLRVAASMTIAEYLVPHWLHRTASGHPRLAHADVELAVANSEHVMELVERRSVDLGFIEGLTLRPGLRSALIGQDRLSVVVDTRHPWALREQPMPVSELLDGHLVVREPGSGTRQVFERAVRGLGYDLPSSITTMGSTSSIKTAVRGEDSRVLCLAWRSMTNSVRGRSPRCPSPSWTRRRPLRVVWVGRASRDPRISALVAAARSGSADDAR